MVGYDLFATAYDDIIRKGSPLNERCFQFVLNQLQDIEGKKICDLGCGQGELSRRLTKCGSMVTGVDFSQKLLDLAQDYPFSDSIEWIQDDAQYLKKIQSEQFDIVVSNLMLMDVPDFHQVFQSAYRILKNKGIMIWVIMHPCFQSPHSETLEDGSRKITNYTDHWWKSSGNGTIRGTLGAYHRSLENYINSFMSIGFRLKLIKELTIPEEIPLAGRQVSHHEIPPLLGAVGIKE
ncbi:class I SAM-dependent methyltransferase [Lederbergia citrea]|uniref:Class I SAM-dependent methyltransferase n=1 Tax=Lederbergia citrea TaxID=2833581 RepID=A0A942UQK8_9BACI|nr:class I SAM-dependent methyltransferase [Lederbergia citrea]MBS4178343.1 class I SAM-dependent methyltransferase [Lederbergia citrea]MBS4223128.1 class I SAM-dependent methyltransferase [Lederbergia citrea]